MNVLFAEYATDGRILRIGSCPASMLSLQGTVISPISPAVQCSTHYVLAGVITARTAMTAAWDKVTIAADGVDKATLATVPAGTVFEINDTPQTVNDGMLEVTAALAGTYHVALRDPRYIQNSWTITAS